jgi:hypothetical protein
MLRATLVATCCLLGAVFNVAAEDTLEQSLKKGKVDINLRYRYERVVEEGFDSNANANTIRLRLGYTTKSYHNFFFNGEYQGNFSITNGYNSTENGKTQYPVVPDPQDSNFSQLFVGYRLFEKTEFKAGRQRVNLDNQRFVGSVAWRQLEQSLDAVSARSKHFEDFSLFYAYVGNGIRVFGEHNPTQDLAETNQDSHLLNAAWDSGVGQLVGYVYLLDFPDNESASHKNLGVRFSGKRKFDDWTLIYTGEYADQSSYRNGSSSIDARYGHAVLGGGCEWATVKLGYELLGGDGTWAIQTPFATLHKFNGWADRFLITPLNGLKDAYASVTGTAAGIQWGVIYHDFTPDTGGGGYGNELDLIVSKTWRKKYTAAVKYGDYSADDGVTGLPGADAKKFWFWLQYKI